jgi:pimeloyl-ACP methyl ester carboxylesterase
VSLETLTVAKETGFFESFDGTPIYYEVRGTGEPLVFVYGIACLMNHWHYQISYFSKHYKVISYDLRGHHKSNPVANLDNLTMESLAKDLIGLLQHLGLSSAHMAGHSFGAPVILDAFKLKPDVVKTMTFVNGFAKNPIKGMFGLDAIEPFFYYIKSQYDLNPDLWNNLWKMAVYNPLAMRLAGLAGGFNLKLTHFKDIEVYARGVAQMDLRIFLPLFEALMKFDGDDILPTIDKPALIISGENDRVTPKSFQHLFHEKIHGSEFVSIPYGSHCTQLDLPDYVNLKMADFLSRHSG